MDLKELFLLMRKKHFYYFDGNLNDTPDIFITFSTGYNSRGESLDIRIGMTDNDIEFFTKSRKVEQHTNISDEEFFSLIKTLPDAYHEKHEKSKKSK